MSLRATVLLAFVLAWPLQPLDDAARGWVLAHRQAGLDAPMRQISKGARPFLIVLAGVGLVSGVAGRAAVLEAVAALVPVNLIVEGLKWTVGRPRPDGDTRRKNSAFPSSHAANAVAVAWVVARRWPRSAIPCGLLAALVAFSRMYLDRHWFSDVAGAALIGVGGALAGGWMVQRWLPSALPRRQSPPEIP